MGGFNTIIPKITPAEVEIPLNKVKLPTPLESDYVTPSTAQGSTTTEDYELRIHSGGITNKQNIYDNNDDTYAHPSADFGAYEKREVMVWDFGTVETRKIYAKIRSTYLDLYTRLLISNDDVNYTVIAEVRGGTRIVNDYYSFRYIKWEAEDISGGYSRGSYLQFYTLNVLSPYDAMDEDLNSFYQSKTESNPYLTVDMGDLKICSGIRVYWGNAGRPSNYKISVSEDNVTWEDVLFFTEAPPADAWMEYIFNARYCRYIRIQALETLAMRIHEVDYYSRIVERVASEHGHGSGITPHLYVKHSSSHPKMMIAETLRNRRIRKYSDFVKKRRMEDLIEYIKALEEELNTLWKIIG